MRGGYLPTLDDIRGGQPRALARAITLLAEEEAGAERLHAEVQGAAGGAFRVGFTGPPGAGKSSLLREVMRRLRAGGERVALVACDPVSPLTGGAFLGDRVRMGGLGQDRGVFIRSIAERDAGSGPSRRARRALDVLDAARFPWVFLESVGVGQGGTGALDGCHLKVLVHSTDGGDSIQMLKAGVLEIAHIHVVGKGERAGAAAWALELAETLQTAAASARGAPVLLASALSGEGMDALVAELRLRREEWEAGRSPPAPERQGEKAGEKKA